MKFHTEYLWFNTEHEHDYINITDEVEEILYRSGIKDGMILVSAMHITAGVYVNDAESGLIHDIEKWLEEVLAAASAGANNAAGDDLKIEKEIIFSALENFERFEKVCGMTGGLLYVDDKPAAFCVASRLSAAVTDVHFEKCLFEYARDGGYAVINNEFSKSVKTEFINREEDLGIEGLRKAKLSYYPEEILEKYNGTIHSA